MRLCCVACAPSATEQSSANCVSTHFICLSRSISAKRSAVLSRIFAARPYCVININILVTQPVRSKSDQTFEHNTRGKRNHEECVSSNLARLPHHPSDDSSSDSGSDGEDSAGLGAPPLLPPTLKRARACSFSPTSSTAREFSKKSSASNTPRQ